MPKTAAGETLWQYGGGFRRRKSCLGRSWIEWYRVNGPLAEDEAVLAAEEGKRGGVAGRESRSIVRRSRRGAGTPIGSVAEVICEAIRNKTLLAALKPSRLIANFVWVDFAVLAASILHDIGIQKAQYEISLQEWPPTTAGTETAEEESPLEFAEKHGQKTRNWNSRIWARSKSRECQTQYPCKN